VAQRKWVVFSFAVGVLLLVAVVAATWPTHNAPARAASHPIAAPEIPTTPHAVPASHVSRNDRRVFVVGDSLTVGTEPWLRSALRHVGWRLTGVNARVGRPVAEGLHILRQHKKSLPPTVVVALGTNDLGTPPSEVAAWLRTARSIVGQRRLVWVNLCLASGSARLAGYRQINTALRKAAPRFHVQVADWCSFATHHRIKPGPDGIHYLTAGYQQRARFYASVVS